MIQKTKILIVEHDLQDIELMEYELRSAGIEFISENVENEMRYYKALKDFAPDIILSDYTFPLFDGPEAFKIRENLVPNTPFIFVSGSIGEENSIELIKNGVTDFVLKDKLYMLSNKVIRALREARLKNEKNLVKIEKSRITRQLAEVSSSIPGAVCQFMVTADGKFSFPFVSKGIADVLGISPEEIYKDINTVFGNTHQDDLPVLMKSVQVSAVNLTPWLQIFRMKQPGDGYKWVRGNAIPGKLADGSTLWNGTLIDVTEMKEAEAKMKFDANLLNAVGQAVIATDLSGELIYWNAAAEKMYGWSAMEVLGKNMLEIALIHNSLDQSIEIMEHLNSGKSWSGEFMAQRKDGRIFPAYVSDSPVYDNNGKLSGIIAVSNDITERKKKDELLEHQNKELQKTNFELDRFVYSASHDLRSPLTSVLGLVGFIEEDSKEPDTLQFAGLIRKSINRMDTFIRNILSYSRNNRVVLEVVNVQLQNMAHEIIESLIGIKEVESIQFEVKIDESRRFYSDSQRISTILENLISNAIKFYDETKSDPFIKIAGLTDSEKLVLIISDNGVGIDEEHIEKIFDMFFSISGRKSGSGLGLYIVKEVAEQLEGTITCQSHLGIGTTFTLTIKNFQHD